MFFVFFKIGYSQNEQVLQTVKWHTFEEAMELNKTNPKKVLIDFYTDWCGWCKVMDKNTFANPNIATFINQNFYAVKFNAETKDTVEYKGKKYFNKGNGNRSANDLTVELLRGQLSYPTIVYLDERSDLITPVPGYMTAEQIEPVLLFFSNDIYKQLTFDKFKEYFEKTFKDSIETTELVKWYTIEEAEKMNKKMPRKIFLDLYADYNPISKIVEKTSYNHPIIAKYINDNFYPVKIDVLSKDTIDFFGTKYINEGKEHPFHQLPVVLLQGKMAFPNVVYISETNQLITSVPGYLSPEMLEPILEFFSKDIYKSMSFDEFRKTFKSKLN